MGETDGRKSVNNFVGSRLDVVTRNNIVGSGLCLTKTRKKKTKASQLSEKIPLLFLLFQAYLHNPLGSFSQQFQSFKPKKTAFTFNVTNTSFQRLAL